MNLSAGAKSSDVGASEACSARMVWVLRTLCLAGLLVSAYLAWTALTMAQVFGCGGGAVFDCSHVLTSKWSKVMGLPVSLPACGLYATLLGMLSFARRSAPPGLTRLLWNGLTVGGVAAGLAALWFVGLQVFALSHVCPYCMTVHACGIVLTVLLLRNGITTARQKSLMVSISVMGVALLIMAQILTPEADNFEVVRYDDAEATKTSASGTAVANSEIAAAPGEYVEAPGEIFEAPGEVFEAPGELFEAPGVETDSSQADTPQPEPAKEAARPESVQPVAANLLLILAPRLLMLSNLPGSLGQESVSAEGAAAPADDAAPEKANPEKANPAPASPERRLVTVAGNRVTLNVRQWPLLGKADARYVFVEMFDYTCPHCRNTHRAIEGALDHFGDDLAIVVLPVPLDPACNPAAGGGGHAGGCEMARIAVAVWRVSPEKFREFHNWMFESSRTAASARTYAEQLVGAREFQKEFSSKIPGDYVKRHIDLYVKVGQGNVPKLMFPKSTINGEVNSTATLCRTIETELRDVAAK